MNKITKEIVEWTICIIIAVVVALLIKYFIGTPTTVKSVSMNPTLIEGQRLILNRLPRTFKQFPKRGDIITFEAPSKTEADSIIANYEGEPEGLFGKFAYHVLETGKKSFIKRVIALPGEHVEIKDKKIYINGEELKEDYLQENVETEVQSSYLQDFVVPENCIFALGDNRSQSMDCRKFGCIPIEKLESIVWIRFWPFSLFGKIDK